MKNGGTELRKSEFVSELRVFIKTQRVRVGNYCFHKGSM